MPSPNLNDDDNNQMMNDQNHQHPAALTTSSDSCTMQSGSWKKSITNLHSYSNLLIPKPLASQPTTTLPTICNHNHAWHLSMTTHHSTYSRRYHLQHQTLQQTQNSTRHINQPLRSIVAYVLHLGQCPLSTTLPQQLYPMTSLNPIQLQRQQFPTGQNQPYCLLPQI